MEMINENSVSVIESMLHSEWLDRDVRIDFYLPENAFAVSSLPILLINDGQDMVKMGFAGMLTDLYAQQVIQPVLFVGLHCSKDRRMEYGVAGQPDYLGRGARADAYCSFVIKELLPYIQKNFKYSSLPTMSFAGFSLGGLSALDIVWKHPDLFSTAGVFSGSLWWRSLDQEDPAYDDDKHRIIHQEIRNGAFKPGLKFFFQCGNEDETKDRNNNGIIDSIDDTLDLLNELKEKGYSAKDVFYVELPDGRHDVATWARAMPYFLKWIFDKKDWV